MDGQQQLRINHYPQAYTGVGELFQLVRSFPLAPPAAFVCSIPTNIFKNVFANSFIVQLYSSIGCSLISRFFFPTSGIDDSLCFFERFSKVAILFLIYVTLHFTTSPYFVSPLLMVAYSPFFAPSPLLGPLLFGSSFVSLPEGTLE